MLDLHGEALILIDPPLIAVLAGVVWEYSLSWPHLRDTEYDMVCLVYLHLLIGLEEEAENFSLVSLFLIICMSNLKSIKVL